MINRWYGVEGLLRKKEPALNNSRYGESIKIAKDTHFRRFTVWLLCYRYKDKGVAIQHFLVKRLDTDSRIHSTISVEVRKRDGVTLQRSVRTLV